MTEIYNTYSTFKPILEKRSRLRRMAQRATCASTKNRRPLQTKQVAWCNTNGHRLQSFSRIQCARLFTVIKKHGVKYQFASTPRVGCQYGTFTIKTLLHLFQNHNLPTWLAFSDLAKAVDTSNHQLMVTILEKYGCTPNLCDTIKRMYKDSVVKLFIG